MPAVHALTVHIGPSGVSAAVTCPYDNQQLPPEAAARPVCRRDDPHQCAATAALRRPGDCWIGPGDAVGAIAVEPVDVDGTLYLRSAEPGPPDHVEAAQALARLSRHPLYGGDGWRRLLEHSTKVDHAASEAGRRGAQAPVVDPLRHVLLMWHADRNTIRGSVDSGLSGGSVESCCPQSCQDTR